MDAIVCKNAYDSLVNRVKEINILDASSFKIRDQNSLACCASSQAFLMYMGRWDHKEYANQYLGLRNHMLTLGSIQTERMYMIPCMLMFATYADESILATCKDSDLVDMLREYHQIRPEYEFDSAPMESLWQAKVVHEVIHVEFYKHTLALLSTAHINGQDVSYLDDLLQPLKPKLPSFFTFVDAVLKLNCAEHLDHESATCKKLIECQTKMDERIKSGNISDEERMIKRIFCKQYGTMILENVLVPILNSAILISYSIQCDKGIADNIKDLKIEGNFGNLNELVVAVKPLIEEIMLGVDIPLAENLVHAGNQEILKDEQIHGNMNHYLMAQIINACKEFNIDNLIGWIEEIRTEAMMHMTRIMIELCGPFCSKQRIIREAIEILYTSQLGMIEGALLKKEKLDLNELLENHTKLWSTTDKNPFIKCYIESVLPSSVSFHTTQGNRYSFK